MSVRVRGFIEEDGTGGFRVGARYIGENTLGPVAEVSHDKNWLHIITDDHEGAAMLNIEALPFLQEALSKIAEKLKTSPQEPKP